MTSMSAGLNGVKRWLGAATIALFAAFVPPASPALSQKADAIAPVEDFSRELEALKKTFTDLGKRIDDGAKSIDGLDRRPASAQGDRGAARGGQRPAERGCRQRRAFQPRQQGPRTRRREDQVARSRQPLQARGPQVPGRPVAQDQGRNRARLERARRRAEGIRGPAAHAAGQRGFHRRAGADPAGQQGDRGDPRTDHANPRRLGQAQDPDRLDPVAGIVDVRSDRAHARGRGRGSRGPCRCGLPRNRHRLRRDQGCAAGGVQSRALPRHDQAHAGQERGRCAAPAGRHHEASDRGRRRPDGDVVRHCGAQEPHHRRHGVGAGASAALRLQRTRRRRTRRPQVLRGIGTVSLACP